MATEKQILVDELVEEIQQSFGFIPPFFEPAFSTPDVLQNLWQQTLIAYINNPLPALFKEKLFTYLSRFCNIPYCLICHSCSLYNFGMNASEVLALLTTPVQKAEEYKKHIAILQAVPGPLTDWPEPDSPLEKSLFACAVAIFLRLPDLEHYRQVFVRLLGAPYYNHLVMFLEYIKTCHFWVETHPELSYSYQQDKRARDHLSSLLREEPELVDFFQHYNEKIRREHQLHKQVLLADIAEQKRVEELVRKSETKFRRLIDSNIIGVFVGNFAGEILEANDAFLKMIGYTQETFYADKLRWMDRTHSEFSQLDKKAAIELIQTGVCIPYEKFLLHKNGTHVPILLGMAVLEEVPEHVVAFVLDLSQRKQLEVKLSESEKGFRETFERAPVGIAHVAIDGQWLRVNQKICNIVGYSREELQALTFQDITYPPDLETDLAYVRELLEGKSTTYSMEKRYIRKDGSLVWINLTVALVRNPSGTPQYFISIIEDLTKRKQLEENLRIAIAEATSRANQLEVVFDTMVDGIFVYDENGLIIQQNAAVRELLELDHFPPNFVSLGLQERLAQYDICNENGKRLVENEWPIHQVLRGEVLKGSSAAEVIVRRPDQIEVHVSISGSPIYDTDGKIIGAVLILRDVTERRQLEIRTHEALNALLAMAETLVKIPEEANGSRSQSNTTASRATGHKIAELTQRILGCLRVSISLLEPETEKIYPLAVVGLSREEEQQWWNDTSNGHLSDYFEPQFIERLYTNEVITRDLTLNPFPTYSSSSYGVRMVLTAPMLMGKQLMGVLNLEHQQIEQKYTQQEITLAGAIAKLAMLILERDQLLQEQARAQARELALLSANHRMDEFLGIASHEFRTPLTVIKTNVQLMLRLITNKIPLTPAEYKLLCENLQKMLVRTDQQVDRLDRLVQDLLDVSRIQGDKLKLHLEASNLTTIVRDYVEQQRMVVPQRQIYLELPAQDEVPVFIDIDRIGQVITNYLTNALKYSSINAPVWVRLQIEEGLARLMVQDMGPGLPEQELGNIWERFYRAEGVEVQSGSGMGLGLGLHICRTIIERHQGQVGVQSTLGQGSTFWFTLPLTR